MVLKRFEVSGILEVKLGQIVNRSEVLVLVRSEGSQLLESQTFDTLAPQLNSTLAMFGFTKESVDVLVSAMVAGKEVPDV